MLVDLGRNDLSRVCRAGTVRVERFMEAERFSHVTHLVSEVVGELRDGVGPVRPPARLLPGGHRLRRAEGARDADHLASSRATGAGRTRARSATRCPDGDLDTCIAIRTIVLHDGVAHLQAGAGIVADSDPRAEHEECLRKLAALETAITSRSRAMILLVDNYDSFTYNLVHLFQELGAEVVVRRNDEIDADEAERLAPSHLVVSPGPGRPGDSGATVEIVRRLAPTTPTLGVCLGHQAIVEAFGGEIGQARELVHGKASAVAHDGRGIFAGLPQDFQAGRYHSLAATRVPDGARGLGHDRATAR